MEDRPLYQVLDDLPEDEYQALKADIEQYGLKHALLLDGQGHVVDGHQRQRACRELGVEPEYLVITALKDATDLEKRSFARRTNLTRRHITNEQKRRLVADEWRERWDAGQSPSVGEVAEALNVSRELAWSVRVELRANGEGPAEDECSGVRGEHLNTSAGRDGKAYPATAEAAEDQRERVEDAIDADPEASVRDIVRLGIQLNTRFPPHRQLRHASA